MGARMPRGRRVWLAPPPPQPYPARRTLSLTLWTIVVSARRV
jgi:hypothetical protein